MLGKWVDSTATALMDSIAVRSNRLFIFYAAILGVSTALAVSSGPAVAVAAGCANEAVRAETDSLALPECRAYEMVTPLYKEGYPIFASAYSVASNGEQVILQSLADLGGAAGSGEGQTADFYLDQRTVNGWKIAPLNPPASQFVGQEAFTRGVDPSNGEMLWEMHTPDESVNTHRLYIRSTAGVFSLIGPLSLSPITPEEPSNVMNAALIRRSLVVGASNGYQHVAIWAAHREDYWPEDETEAGGSLYEYTGTGNSEPTLVGVTGEKGSTDLVTKCGTELGSANGRQGSVYNAISTTGETIFFTADRCENGQAEVYARERGSVKVPGEAKTTNVSTSECTESCGSETETSGKHFEGASRNGERVFFTSTQKLTNSAVNGVASGTASEGEGCSVTIPGAGGCNLYEYDLVTKQLKTAAAGEVLGVVGIAESGSRIYFVSRAEMAGASVNTPGREGNLYVYDTVTAQTKFIAKLGGQDYRDWQIAFTRPAEVAGSEGQFLLFVSSTPGLVSSDDTTETSQLFEYDALSEELVRVSQGEAGYNDNGNGVTSGVVEAPLEELSKALGDGEDMKSSVNRSVISADGNTVFFLTTGQLSPRAVSAEAKCRSLYEFHTDGALSEGNVHLVSDGRDTHLYKGQYCGVEYVGMDESGANVLFETDDSLVAGDNDGGQRDIYDARVDGGFSVRPDGSEGACAGALCEGAVSTSSPGAAALGSAGGDGEAPVPAVSSQVNNETSTTTHTKSSAKTKRKRQKIKKKRVHNESKNSRKAHR